LPSECTNNRLEQTHGHVDLNPFRLSFLSIQITRIGYPRYGPRHEAMLWDKHVGQHDFPCNVTRFGFKCCARSTGPCSVPPGGMRIRRIGITNNDLSIARSRHTVSWLHDETLHRYKWWRLHCALVLSATLRDMAEQTRECSNGRVRFLCASYLLFLSKALLDMVSRSLGVREPCKRQEALKDM
jgi:hypothetical protein